MTRRAQERKIALEEHYVTAEFASPATNVTSELFAEIQRRLLDVGQRRLESMDAHGIELSVLSLNMPGIQGIADPKAAVASSRAVNDSLSAVVGDSGGRFAGFGTVPLQDPSAAVAELTRCVRELGFVGVMVNGYTSTAESDVGLYLDDPRYEDFWAAVEELDRPVYLHPRNPLPRAAQMFAGRPELAGAVWGFTVETATHALRLITGGVFDRHPRAQVVLGHLGEGLPFLIRRIDQTFRVSAGSARLEHPPSHYLQHHFHVTTSGNFSTPALMATLTEMGADRVMFSVDYPWASTAEAAGWFDELQLGDSDWRKIAYLNARQLLRLG